MTRRRAVACAAACIGDFVIGCRGVSRRHAGTTAATPKIIPRALDQEDLKKTDWLLPLDQYPTVLEQVLLEPYPNRVCEMLAIPPFDLEHAAS